MAISEKQETLAIKNTLIDLASYRKADRIEGGKPDPIIVFAAYGQDELVYKDGKMIPASPAVYNEFRKSLPNELVNKFGLAYVENSPLFLHKKLADVLVDTAIDLRDRRGYFTVVMDGLRTFDAAVKLQESRPDLVEMGLLTKAGFSAHNRALAVDSKLFYLIETLSDPTQLVPLSALSEVDEHGHLDDLNMVANSRFFDGPMSDAARHNRLVRLQAWQRASVKNHLAIANLLSEFWDDRVTGSPSDMWRVLACRALCLGMNASPDSNPIIGALKQELAALHHQHQQGHKSRSDFAHAAHQHFTASWDQLFSKPQKLELNSILGIGGGEAPALADFIFHEWLENIYEDDLLRAGLPRQLRTQSVEIRRGAKGDIKQFIPDGASSAAQPANVLAALFYEAKSRK